VAIRVRSSFNDEPGTLITKEAEKMEDAVIRGVTMNTEESKFTVMHVPDKPGVAALLFKRLAQENVNVDMIIQNISEKGKTDISFTVMQGDFKKAKKLLETLSKEIGAEGVLTDENIAKVSIVGIGMKSHSGVAATMFEALAQNNINIEMISTSEIKVSCVIRKDAGNKAVRALHEAFHLDKELIPE
jgi:aspartate kinase